MVRDAWRILQVMALLACGGCVLSGGFGAVHAARMAALTVSGITPGGVIPRVFAYCVPAKQGHVGPGPNKSPAIKWSKGPAGTASYAITMVDPDAPTVFDRANKEGQIIPAQLKRRDFHHWILVNIPSSVTGLPEGAESTGHGDHHYHFSVYALDVRSLGLSGGFTVPDALRAMEGHVLAKGEVVGIYTLNPDVAKTLGIKF